MVESVKFAMSIIPNCRAFLTDRYPSFTHHLSNILPVYHIVNVYIFVL